MFEGGSEFFYEVVEGTHGVGGSGNGLLSEGSGPGLGCSSGHVGECKGNLLGMGIVYCVVDLEIEEDSREPWCGF